MLLDEQNDIRRNITTIGLPIVLLVILFMLFIYKLYGGGESELYKLTQTDKSYRFLLHQLSRVNPFCLLHRPFLITGCRCL